MPSRNRNDPDGYAVPVHRALTQPPLFAGAPRDLGIITLVVTLVIALGLRLWWLGIPLGLGMHTVAVLLTRRDPQWMAVFRRHLRQPNYLD